MTSPEYIRSDGTRGRGHTAECLHWSAELKAALSDGSSELRVKILRGLAELARRGCCL